MSRVALVTGGTRGIGAAISMALKNAGYKVAANYAGNDEKAQAFKQETGIPVYKWDVSNYQACAEGIAKVEADLGPVDVLVNNAGIQHIAPIEEFPTEKWDWIIAINLTSSFHTMRVAIPLMKKAGKGRIINIASAHGLVASPFKSAYVAAKHGIMGLTKTAALELAQTGVTVNAICPGYVLTPLVEKQIPEMAKVRGISEEAVKNDVMLELQATKQFVTIDDVAAAALFLASDAASNITGTHISVDGGWTAQ